MALLSSKNYGLALAGAESDEAEVATIIDFNKGSVSAKNQYAQETLDRNLPITYVDPLTG